MQLQAASSEQAAVFDCDRLAVDWVVHSVTIAAAAVAAALLS
jgi:hypothetical protein